HLRVRRFFCRNDACAAVTLAEPVPALASRHARRTAGLTGTLEAIALALRGQIEGQFRGIRRLSPDRQEVVIAEVPALAGGYGCLSILLCRVLSPG
ncbi:MAG TPA: hypothetical protein VK599_22755, partial [Streptosporangiaceae bacterium]|nr:hypothetical protein [Streptosporangiaceae bacterium]